jgi:hypothetical protein
MATSNHDEHMFRESFRPFYTAQILILKFRDNWDSQWV